MQQVQARATTRKFRNRPVVVEAYQLAEAMHVDTVDGTMLALPGDYVVVDARGHATPYRQDEFALRFEPVAEDEPLPPPTLAGRLRQAEGLPRLLDVFEPAAHCIYVTFADPIGKAERRMLTAWGLEATWTPPLRNRYMVTWLQAERNGDGP